MIAQAYIDFCEGLWSDWLAGRSRLPRDASNRFQLDYSPEPYLRFSDGTKPFCVLLTNPGAGMPHQHRDTIQAGNSCIGLQMSYQQVSLALGRYYREQLPAGHARRNIQAMHNIKELLHADCIVQLESLPFHSGSLPRKAEIPAVVERTSVLSQYASALKDAMKSVSVVALSAVASSRPISSSSIADDVWLRWQAADLLGIDPTGLLIEGLVEKRGKITSAFLYQRVARCTRGFVLTMGGNTFPGEHGQKRLARVLTSGD